MLVDLSGSHLTGLEAEQLLDRVGITANKNAIPADPRPPKVTSGLRVGTPAVTTRGFGPEEIREVAAVIVEVLTTPGISDAALEKLRARTRRLTDSFALYATLSE
jgi:glycine hydroxymethyltransferase